GTPEDGGMEHAGEPHVVGVGGAPGQKLRILEARDILADPLSFDGCHRGPPQRAAAPAGPREAASRTASTMPWYPVHRQRLAEIDSRTSCSFGDGVVRSSSWAIISIPGVQNPHWSPWASRKASCSGLSRPPSLRPSTVVSSAPFAETAS